MIYKTPNNLK